MTLPSTPPATDFDFFPGHWQVSYRRLKQRKTNSTDWEDLGGTCSVQTLLGGLGNVDDNVIDLPGAPYRAVTLRFYNAATQQWTI